MIEIQVRRENDTGFWIFEYSSRLHASGSHRLADEIRGPLKTDTPIAVCPIVIVLKGSAKHQSGIRNHHWTHPSRRSGYFHYEVRRVYKMTQAEMMALPCFHWVFLPLAADATRETLVAHFRKIKRLIRTDRDPIRHRRLASIAACMSVVAKHSDDPTLQYFVNEVFREEIMDTEWYKEAARKGRQEGRQEGREDGCRALLAFASRCLSAEQYAKVASITDLGAMEAALAEMAQPSR